MPVLALRSHWTLLSLMASLKCPRPDGLIQMSSAKKPHTPLLSLAASNMGFSLGFCSRFARFSLAALAKKNIKSKIGKRSSFGTSNSYMHDALPARYGVQQARFDSLRSQEAVLARYSALWAHYGALRAHYSALRARFDSLRSQKTSY